MDLVQMVSLLMQVLTLSLLNAEFEDAIKEGDGERVVHCWWFSY